MEHTSWVLACEIIICMVEMLIIMIVCICRLVSMEYTWMVSVYGLEPCGLVRNRGCPWIIVVYNYRLDKLYTCDTECVDECIFGKYELV